MSNNKLYIVWSEAEFILGVYKNKEDALLKYKEYNSFDENSDTNANADEISESDESEDNNYYSNNGRIKSNKRKEYEIWASIDNLKEFKTVHANNFARITVIDYAKPKSKHLYACVVHESGGGGSYHEVSCCSVGFSVNSVIKFASLHFDCEHSRPELSDEDNCEYCRNNYDCDMPQCKKQFISELKKDMYSEITHLCGLDSIDVEISKYDIC